MSKAISWQAKKRGTPEAESLDVSSRASEVSFSVPTTSIHKVEADGVRVFYRAAGDPAAPVILLLHGFPASSFMFRELIPRLAIVTASSHQISRVSDLRRFRPNERIFIHSTDWPRQSEPSRKR